VFRDDHAAQRMLVTLVGASGIVDVEIVAMENSAVHCVLPRGGV